MIDLKVIAKSKTSLKATVAQGAGLTIELNTEEQKFDLTVASEGGTYPFIKLTDVLNIENSLGIIEAIQDFTGSYVTDDEDTYKVGTLCYDADQNLLFFIDDRFIDINSFNTILSSEDIKDTRWITPRKLAKILTIKEVQS
jgi:hypothetical protein